MQRDPNVAGFWSWFADHQAEISQIVAGQRAGRVTDQIDAALEANAINLTYEVTRGHEGPELTFTPCGDPDLVPFIDYFVSKAPKLPGWKIFSRIQRKSLTTALAFVKAIHGIDLSDAHFKSVILEDQYHLCFLHDGLFALPEEKRYAIAGTLLDHALGEDITMEFIGEIDFRRSAEGVAMPLLINEIIRETAEGVLDTPTLPTPVQ